jgi:hypothetical protein
MENVTCKYTLIRRNGSRKAAPALVQQHTVRGVLSLQEKLHFVAPFVGFSIKLYLLQTPAYDDIIEGRVSK